jgi:hypothetical protein
MKGKKREIGMRLRKKSREKKKENWLGGRWTQKRECIARLGILVLLSNKCRNCPNHLSTSHRPNRLQR